MTQTADPPLVVAPPAATVMRVAKDSVPANLAGAIAKALRAHGIARLSCVGAAAVNQAVKAIAVARRYLDSSGDDLVCMPSFADVVIDGQSRTTVQFEIELCDREVPT